MSESTAGAGAMAPQPTPTGPTTGSAWASGNTPGAGHVAVGGTSAGTPFGGPGYGQPSGDGMGEDRGQSGPGLHSGVEAAEQKAREAVARLTKALEPAIIMVFAALAMAYALPSAVYADATPHPEPDGRFGYGAGVKSLLALLMLVALGLAAAGTWAAWKRLQENGPDRGWTRAVLAVGAFTVVFAFLQFVTALAR